MWRAFSFLTTLPVPARQSEPPDTVRLALGRAAVWFPFVGLVLGLLLGAVNWVLARFFTPLLAGALLVSLWAALTGGLHLDGLADCGDGLLAATTRERRLDIMRDPRLGSFGGLSLILFLLLKILAVAELAYLPHQLGLGLPAPLAPDAAVVPAIVPLVVAAVTARWLILLAALQPAARPGGLGAAFAAGLQPTALWAAGAFTGAVALLGGAPGLAAVLVAHLSAVVVFGVARARLGGLTGDVFGLTVELAELVVLLVYAASVSP